MDDREFELVVERLMKVDLSQDTHAFRDALLKRCLDELGADDECASISDEDLELLAAAGDMHAFELIRQNSSDSVDGIS